jgi:hypothetical protein
MAMLNILSFYEDFSNLEIVLLHIFNATLQYTSSSAHIILSSVQGATGS